MMMLVVMMMVEMVVLVIVVMMIRTTHYQVHAAREAFRKFSVSMSSCRLLILVVH